MSNQSIPPPQSIPTQYQQMPPVPLMQQQWGAIPPPVPQHYQQPQPPALWNQQPSQIPPPAPQYAAQAPAVAQPGAADEVRTLWIGGLQYWMDENYVYSCFAQSGEVISVKLIRDKQTMQLQGYGFVEFATHATAERVVQTYNGQLMPNSDQTFRLNWATYGAGEKREGTPDYTIFVGDLAADVTDYILQETFKLHYPSVKGAKVLTDKATGHSKGYGFVRFSDESEQTRAMTEMNGMYCSSRPMRIGPATTKNSTGTQHKAFDQNTQGQSESDPNNTTIFVGGLDSNVTEDVLQQVFAPYGELIHVKIPVGKRCGFVQFANKTCAEKALLMLQGTVLGGQTVRLSWGRSPSNKQPQQDTTQWSGNNYGYGGQGYDPYGYAQQPQDPNAYSYGAYQGYGNYQHQ